MSIGPMLRATFGTHGDSAMTVHSTVKRTTRYTVVGAICAATYNAIMIFGSAAGGDYVSLSVLSYLVLTPIGYLLHARFTFGTRRSWQDFARFASCSAASFPIYFVVMAGLCSGLHLSVPIAAPVTTVAMYLWNYTSSHWALRSPLPLRPRMSAQQCPASSVEPEDCDVDGFICTSNEVYNPTCATLVVQEPVDASDCGRPFVR